MKTLLELLRRMDLPDHRKENDTIHNVRWLARNLGVRNEDHPNFDRTMEVIKRILKGEDNA